MLADMSKVRIIVPKRLVDRLIEELHAAKAMHIVEDTISGPGQPLAASEEISDALVKLRAIAAQLRIPLTPTTQYNDLKLILKELSVLIPLVQKNTDTIKQSDAKLKELSQFIEKERMLHSLSLKKQDLYNYESISCYIGTVDNVEACHADIEHITRKFKLTHCVYNKRSHIALFAEKNADVKSVLANHGFSPLLFDDLPDIDLQAAYADSKHKKEAAEKRLAQIAPKYKNLLPIYENTLSDALEKAEIPLQFRETSAASIVYGFIPALSVSQITEKLQKAFRGRIYIESIKTGHHEKVPVELTNIPPVRNFKFFLDLYSLPKYKEIDPSWFLFLTFPLLFGFMLGDWGYGITTLLIFWLLKKKMPQMKSFFNILIFSSWATVFFGLIFGEFFGIEFYHPLISRNPEFSLMPLMIVAIIIGILHVNAGLIAGFINEFKGHGLKAAIFRKGGWMLLEVGIALLAASYTHVISLAPIVGYLVLALAITFLYKGEGATSLVEIPGIFGNILSYVRLMAIGLSSVGLALVVNDLAEGFFHSDLAIVGIIILVLGHAINITLGCLGSFLHSLRLHYVELFTKFYHGGGIPFKPFGMKNEI
ncbi:MAG TPA: V-type ATP synthase subunit I [Candidatus Nanoarchaeia archaeon]|nr:V-type ATP synthase subunit I [Candidatus Nanoarchaeia archaeon]